MLNGHLFIFLKNVNVIISFKLTNELFHRPHSAPNGDYSPSNLQAVRDEVFISIFDEVLYEMVEVQNYVFRHNCQYSLHNKAAFVIQCVKNG